MTIYLPSLDPLCASMQMSNTPSKECPRYDTILHLMVKLHSWRWGINEFTPLPMEL